MSINICIDVVATAAAAACVNDVTHIEIDTVVHGIVAVVDVTAAAGKGLGDVWVRCSR